MDVDQIALQLYTVRDLAASRPAGNAPVVAAAGYRFVEVAGLPETPAERARDAPRPMPGCRRRRHEGIDGPAAPTPTPSPTGSRRSVPDRLIVPWMPARTASRPTMSGVSPTSSSGFARPSAGRGIRLGYHNHAFEFEPLDGTTVWDVLLDRAAPDVDLEVDVYWAAVGGRDPVAAIRRGRRTASGCST